MNCGAPKLQSGCRHWHLLSVIIVFSCSQRYNDKHLVFEAQDDSSLPHPSVMPGCPRFSQGLGILVPGSLFNQTWVYQNYFRRQIRIWTSIWIGSKFTFQSNLSLPKLFSQAAPYLAPNMNRIQVHFSIKPEFTIIIFAGISVFGPL